MMRAPIPLSQVKGAAPPQPPGVHRWPPPSAAASLPHWLVALRLSSRRQISPPPRWFTVPLCSLRSLWGRVLWLPVPLALQAVRKRLFPAPWQLLCSPALLPVVCPHSCAPSLPSCTSLSHGRRVSSPSYPWTLELRPSRTQLAWNTPGLASPFSLFETCDQSDLKRLTPAL
jgi:hypothetical protein